MVVVCLFFTLSNWRACQAGDVAPRFGGRQRHCLRFERRPNLIGNLRGDERRTLLDRVADPGLASGVQRCGRRPLSDDIADTGLSGQLDAVGRACLRVRVPEPDFEGGIASKSCVPSRPFRGSSAISMYQRCISSGNTGLCWSVRPVSVCAPITPARSTRFNTNRHRPVHPDTVVFQIWEQEAGSSNLPTPTGVAGLDAARRSRCVRAERHEGTPIHSGKAR
jgi:hypothetical protein